MKTYTKLFVILAVTATVIIAWYFLIRGSDSSAVSFEMAILEDIKDSEDSAQLKTTTNTDSEIAALKKKGQYQG